jgi:hypothetical protein
MWGQMITTRLKPGKEGDLRRPQPSSERQVIMFVVQASFRPEG